MTSSSPPTGFFENLLFAHARIEEQLQDLERAAEAIVDPARAPEAVEAMTRVLAFFSGYAQLHQEDEDKTLFPRLRPLPAFARMLDAFDLQHRMAESEHRSFEARLRKYAPGAERALRGAAERFVELQRAHMAAEERALFPLAQQTLPRSVLVAMSEELRTPDA
jgi:hemerythrin-like domain-containing protein